MSGGEIVYCRAAAPSFRNDLGLRDKKLPLGAIVSDEFLELGRRVSHDCLSGFSWLL
jgi:hypothetical protein